VEEVIALLRFGSRLQTQCLNLTIPAIGRGAWPRSESTGTRDETVGGYQDAVNLAYAILARVRFEAEAAGVAIALEAGAGGAFLSPVELRELIDAANSSAFGVCVDVQRIASFAHPEDWLATLGHRVHSIRVPQRVPDGLSQRVRAAGAIDLAAIGAVLDEIEYGRSIIIDTGDDPAEPSPRRL
jgi:sugar phosphate isomerase/epimerase